MKWGRGKTGTGPGTRMWAAGCSGLAIAKRRVGRVDRLHRLHRLSRLPGCEDCVSEWTGGAAGRLSGATPKSQDQKMEAKPKPSSQPSGTKRLARGSIVGAALFEDGRLGANVSWADLWS